MKKFILSLVIFLKITIFYAAYFNNLPYTVKQPDGTVIHCFASGDEFFNWLHDKDGYTIIQADNGYYYYGIKDGDYISPSLYKVNSVIPGKVGLQKWAKISTNAYQEKRKLYYQNVDKSIKAPHSGTLNNLVVYIRFGDQTEFTDTRQYFDDKFNPSTGNSLKSYFSETSYNMLTISSTHYPVCALTTNLSYQDTYPRNYYSPYNAATNPDGYVDFDDRMYREHTLLANAINDIASQVPASLNIDADGDDYADNVCFIIRGGNDAWAELLWAHRWSLYSEYVYINGKQVYDYTFQPETQNTVRVLCHEMFHVLSAPDLYHYDTNFKYLTPVANWDIMAKGKGHMGAYMKWRYSENTWISSLPQITSPGTYSLNPLDSSTNNCYKIASPYSTTEFFVVEYRQATGTFEGNLPGSGLLVYRINTDFDDYGNAYYDDFSIFDEVYIYRPDGTILDNGTPDDAYFSSDVDRTSITDATNPSSFLHDGSNGGLNILNVTSAGATISFTVFLTSTIDENNLSNDFINIFPNPVKDKLIITCLAKFCEDVKVMIYNIDGKLIMEEPVMKTKSVINVSKLSEGVYFVKVSDSKNTTVRKFVKY